MEKVPRELLSIRRDMGLLERGQNNPVVQSSVTCYQGGSAGRKLAAHQG